MLTEVIITKGEEKRRITLCKPIDQESTLILKDFYPDTQWLSTLPFDTSEFVLFISGDPLGNKAAVTLPPIPYARPAGDYYTRFEIQDGKDRHIRTSNEYPVTQLLLTNSELDPEIISEKKPIYLGVSPIPTPDELDPDRGDEDGEGTPRLIIDGPEEFGIDVSPLTTVVCGPDIDEDDGIGDDPDEDDPYDDNLDEDALPDEQLARKFLSFFLQHNIRFSKGSRLTSAMLHAAIEASAPTAVPIDLLSRREIVTAFRQTFGIVMDRTGKRIGGKNDKSWKDYEVRIFRPDPLERSWYV